jgi:plasmid stabilization system protein ParE
VSLPVVLKSEADADLAAARDRYEQQDEGLGDEFLDEVDIVLDRIGQFPELYCLIENDVRRVKVGRFPYLIYYHVLPECVEVLGVLHAKRDASVWQARM